MASKYPLVLYSQMSMLAMDMLFNALSVLLFGRNTALLLTYILQDTLSVMCLIVLFVSFSSTFLFQVGLIQLILFTFLPSIVTSVVYIVLSILVHYATLSGRWTKPDLDIWSVPMLTLYIGHKFWAAIYYSYYKRAALHLSDPKYNGDSEWLRKKFTNFFLQRNAENQPPTNETQTLQREN